MRPKSFFFRTSAMRKRIVGRFLGFPPSNPTNRPWASSQSCQIRSPRIPHRNCTY